MSAPDGYVKLMLTIIAVALVVLVLDPIVSDMLGVPEVTTTVKAENRRQRAVIDQKYTVVQIATIPGRTLRDVVTWDDERTLFFLLRYGDTVKVYQIAPVHLE